MVSSLGSPIVATFRQQGMAPATGRLLQEAGAPLSGAERQQRQSLADLGLQPHARAPGLAQPGNVARLDQARVSTASAVQLPRLQALLSGSKLPELPRAMVDEVRARACAISTAADPLNVSWNEGGNFAFGQSQWRDAFRAQVEVDGAQVSVLPEAILTTSFLNASLDTQLKGLADKHSLSELQAKLANIRGQQPPYPHQRSATLSRQERLWQHVIDLKKAALGQSAAPASQARKFSPDFPNTLSDPSTGFAASISVRDGREVQINFSGMGSQGLGKRQFWGVLRDLLGMRTPKHYLQASRLTMMVKQHVDQLNSRLPPDRQLSLSLSGHSMGGAMASYAALRHEVPAVVLNPLRLGSTTAGRLGPQALGRAPTLIKEVVVQGDWVADNPSAKRWYNFKARALAGERHDGLGQRYLVAAPSTERLERHFNTHWVEDRPGEAAQWARRFDRHNGMETCLSILIDDQQAPS